MKIRYIGLKERISEREHFEKIQKRNEKEQISIMKGRSGITVGHRNETRVEMMENKKKRKEERHGKEENAGLKRRWSTGKYAKIFIKDYDFV